MIRNTIGLAVLVGALAVIGGTSQAKAAGGTYRITAGGDQNWTPTSGALDQSGSVALSAAGEMRGGGNAQGNADYTVAAGPGVVRASLKGSFNTVSNAPFDPSVQAVAATGLLVSGPASSVATSLNVHVDGTIAIPSCTVSCNIAVHIEAPGAVSEFQTTTTSSGVTNETRFDGLGLTVDTIPGGLHVHGDVATPQFVVPTNTPITEALVVVIGVRGVWTGSFDGNFDDSQSLLQVSLAPTGPVLNLPAGYDVSGESVVNNRWTDPFGTGGPVDTTPPVVVGVPDRQPNVLGWYRAPVTIDWQATDGSGQASDPADTVAATDGKDVVYTSGQSCDGAGNCATGSLTVSLDRVAPTVTCPRPAPVFELNRGGATIEPSASDSLSGLTGGSIGVPDVSSVGPKSITFSFDDKAGNTTTVSCDYTVVDPSLDRTPPVVTVPPDVTVDATGPAGAQVAYTATATDNLDASPRLACTPASGNVFPIGTTTVTCTAEDATGNSATASFNVRVRSAGEQVLRLIDKTLADLDLASWRPLFRAELQLAANALAASRPQGACAALVAYVATVRLAPAPALTQAERTDLIADANRIRAVIGCG